MQCQCENPNESHFVQREACVFSIRRRAIASGSGVIATIVCLPDHYVRLEAHVSNLNIKIKITIAN